MADIKMDYYDNAGSGSFDRCFFTTVEDCIIGGWTQKTPTSSNHVCYRKFPGGYIRQFGEQTVRTAGQNLDVTITLPIAFANYGPINIDVYLYSSADPWNYKYTQCLRVRVSNSQFRVVNISGLNADSDYELHWSCEGF